MTANEAARILKEKYNDKSIIECLDFVDFYAFAIADKGKEDDDFAGGYYTVNKKKAAYQLSIQPMIQMRTWMQKQLILTVERPAKSGALLNLQNLELNVEILPEIQM